jgi:Fe2+ or Zn2+ uptake regulation protein
MSHENVQWEEMLRRAGYRATRQRGLILDAICAGAGHTTLGEIFARASRLDSSLDRSTVYRSLKAFIDAGLVVVANTGDGEMAYEISRPEAHHHLVCRQCGWEHEIDASLLVDMFDRVEAQHGFEIVTDHLVLFGTCAQCRTRTTT